MQRSGRSRGLLGQQVFHRPHRRRQALQPRQPVAAGDQSAGARRLETSAHPLERRLRVERQPRRPARGNPGLCDEQVRAAGHEESDDPPRAAPRRTNAPATASPAAAKRAVRDDPFAPDQRRMFRPARGRGRQDIGETLVPQKIGP